jgi:hypothetical protein
MEEDDSEEEADGGESEEDEGEHEDDEGESEEEEEEKEHEELRAILDKYKLEWLSFQINGQITMAQRDEAFSEIFQTCEREMLRKGEEIMEEEEYENADEVDESEEEEKEEEGEEDMEHEVIRAIRSKHPQEWWKSQIVDEMSVAQKWEECIRYNCKCAEKLHKNRKELAKRGIVR